MKKLLLITISFIFFLTTGFVVADGWNVPEKYKNMKNPHKGDKTTLVTGKILYNKHCKSCHGTTGNWDGPKAKQLQVPSEKFSTEKFKLQTDGTIYYKSFVGNKYMPNYEKKIVSEEDRWSIVNYMKTF